MTAHNGLVAGSSPAGPTISLLDVKISANTLKGKAMALSEEPERALAGLPIRRSGRAELTPVGQSSGTISLELGSADEVALLIEVVVDRGTGGGELLQAAHPPEALHRPFSSSQRFMCILSAVVQPAARALAALGTGGSQGRAVGAKPVCHDDLGLPVPPECLPQEFQRRLAVPPLADEGFQRALSR
jgi:hypothetical protein